MTRWDRLTGGASGEEYAARFAALAARGEDVHGEATFVDGLVVPGSRVLDAGCGTGRVAFRLAELGHHCVGVDVDASMLAVARREAPGITWVHGDLADLPDEVRRDAPYDLVVLAGNVVPLLAAGTLSAVVAGLTDLLRPGGLLVAGFGLDDAHLPRGCPVTPLAEYDDAATALTPVDRFSTWQAAPFDKGAGYVVTVHRR
ncbi:MAG TPA: class I SAM-dependent methyltransferase [Nocardioides sp.]|uniref:class I SAM-dependent methyltransferase n=1 Tax=Nocardioides sp. TaxID=35761 RepID=UPI002D80FD9E|nr:class I SAM-dependent methyltransferase [Nocardioides sp.]HET6652313.1 class I SAM-dependent methyltransferase [Nocardioides sp.]